MCIRDRNYLSSALRSAYRGAGLSHVLVVSGMHVSILCGNVFGSVFGRRRRERSYRSRRVKALFTAFLALLLAGVTGFTPSVCRAAVAVWVSALGVWVYGASDALTSLAAAGILMTARNSYAVCDIGFELSFAAVLGLSLIHIYPSLLLINSGMAPMKKWFLAQEEPPRHRVTTCQKCILSLIHILNTWNGYVEAKNDPDFGRTSFANPLNLSLIHI